MNDDIRLDGETNALSNDDLGDVTGGTANPRRMAVGAGATAARKGGTNPLHSAAANTTEPSTELPDADLENVAGGKVSMQNISVVKKLDNSSSKLF